MKKQNPFIKETIQREFENIYSRSSKLLAEFINSFAIELNEICEYDS